MKKLILLFICTLGFTGMQAQCEYENGDFEIYLDLSHAIDTTETIAPATILFPKGYRSYIRILIMTLESLMLEPGSQEYVDFWSHGLGVEPSEDAYQGDYALKLKADSISELSDILHIMPCDRIPEYIKFYYKHVGEGRDSLTLVTVTDTGFNLNDEEYRLVDAAAGVIFQFTSHETDEGYTMFQSTYQRFNDKPVDTLVTLFLLNSNIEDIAAGKESYFLIDGLELGFEPSSTKEDLFSEIKMYPNPALNFLRVSTPVDMEATILDSNGKTITKVNLDAGVNDHIPLDGLSPGIHYINFLSKSGNRYLKPFLKM